jgi:glycerol-3-phosphate dehydrogenase
MLVRAVHAFAQKVYDVAIIGGGIYGANVAREAAMRGLSVALVEQGDFNAGTSANSHKIIHGGLRYLQHADFPRMRESIRERSALMRIAPHLVHPMPFLLPTLRGSLTGKLVMWAALHVNDSIAFDRNRKLSRRHRIPPGRVISRAECLNLCPGMDRRDLTGGALFFDAQVHNPDRLTLTILQAAAEAGADLANYVEVVGFLEKDRVIAGVKVRDLLTEAFLEVRARYVVNCGGPWVSRILDRLPAPIRRPRVSMLKAMVLVTRPLTRGIAIGLPGSSEHRDRDALINRGHRNLFITPWRDRSLVGTFQAPCDDDDPKGCRVTGNEVEAFLREINSSLPSAKLDQTDVHFVYAGLIPRGDSGSGQAGAQLLKHSQIMDHEREEGLRGLISVVGVKYTTARAVAEQVVDVLLAKLERPQGSSRTAWLPLPGGQISDLDEFLETETRKRPSGITESVLHHLIHTYGSRYREVLKYGEEDRVWNGPMSSGGPVIQAEVLHGIRREMAQTLGDIVFRRTELGTAGHPGDACLEHCADILQRELGWDRARRHSEIDHVQTVFSQRSYQQWATA